MDQIALRLKATRVFQRNWSSKAKIVLNRGGTRSSKTVSILQICLIWLLTGKCDDDMYFNEGVLSIVRKYWATHATTAQRDRENEIRKQKLDWLLTDAHRNKSSRTYTYMGRIVEFIGADNEQKIRWWGRKILYCNEANELDYDNEFFQLMIRTEYKVFIDFNPDDEYVWINAELEQKRALEDKDVDIIVSTYKDNPFLPAWMVKEIERLEHANPSYWKIYGLGAYGKLEGLVFPKWGTIDGTNLTDEGYTFLWYGQDFGFTTDPTTLIGLYKKDNKLVFDEVIYKTGLTNPDICKEYENNSVSRSAEIIADCAEPKSIEEIHRLNRNIHPSEKGKDSIRFGINLITQFEIYITTRSANLKKELRTYTWKKDKNGKSLNEPVDTKNHGIDAMRYIATKKLGNGLKLKALFLNSND